MEAMDEKQYCIDWIEYYKLAQIYFNHYGNLKMTRDFRTSDGITYDKNGIDLGKWVLKNHNMYINNILGDQKNVMLQKIGIDYTDSTNNKDWNEIYKLARLYCIYSGKNSIPLTFKTKNGYDYDKNGIEIGRWINNQRILYKNKLLSEEQIQLLEKIGFRPNIKSNKGFGNVKY